MNDSTRLIMQILADERNVIPYRVPLARAIGSITSTIFLQQVQYWWVRQGFQPFYKFRSPCTHSFYKKGDSWCEELGFTTGGFDTARRHVAIKKIAGMTMAEARVLTRKDDVIKPVIYWTNAGRLTYYTIHAPALEELLVRVYLNTESVISKLRNPELANSGNQSLQTTESEITISEPTKSHQEPTTADAPAFPEALPSEPVPHPTIERLRREAGDDYLSLAAHCATTRHAANVPADLSQRPTPWQTNIVSDAEFAICQRVADLWAGGKMAGIPRFIDPQVEAAGEVLRMFDDDVGKALETIMLYHEQYEADWQRTGQRPFTVAGPQSLVNVLRTFEAEASYETEAPPRARRMLF